MSRSDHTSRTLGAGLRGLVADTPPAGFAIVALAQARVLLLASAACALGVAIDHILPGRPVTGPVLIAVLLALGAGAAAAVETVLPSRIQAAEEPRLRRGLAEAHLRVDPDDAEPAGAVVARLGDEVERVANYRGAFLGPFLAALVVPVVTLLVMGFLFGAVPALVLAACILCAPPVLTFALTRLRSSGGAYRAASSALATEYIETVRGLGTIALLDAGAQRRERLVAHAEAVRTGVMRLLRRNQLVILVTDGVFGLAVLTASAVVALALVASGSTTIGAAFALLLCARLLLEPVDQLGRSFYVGMAGRANAARLRQRLSRAPAPLPEPPHVPQHEPSGRAVRLEHVTVVRGGETRLRVAELELPSGSLTAVIGPSGAGKSTLALAIAGLLDRTSGDILVDGSPADEDVLRRSVAYVPQRAAFVSGTIGSNLRLGAPGASDREVWEALDTVGLARELCADGRGLETPVVGPFPSLSGGQAARLAIARALLASRSVLVLDEPTAQLDAASAARVLDAVRALRGRTTVLHITHRREETAIADAVVSVDAGEVLAP